MKINLKFKALSVLLSELDPMEDESPSKDEMEVQNDTHSRENSITEPSTTISLGSQEICSRDEITISNINENDQDGIRRLNIKDLI